MRLAIASTILPMVLVTTSLAADDNEAKKAATGWQVYSAGGFSFEMPGQPEEQKDKADGIVITKYALGLDNGHTAYIAAYSKDETGADEEAVVKKLDAIRDQMAQKPGHKLLRERKIKVQGFPGRDLLADAPDNLTIHRRYVLARGKLFQLIVVTSDQSRAGPADISRFFGSLKILDERAAVRADYAGFVDAIAAANAKHLRDMAHPKIQARIDEPVLRLILLALRKEFGAVEQPEPDDLKTTEDDGVTRTSATVGFERGKTRVSVSIQNGKIVAFDLDLKPLGDVDAKMYNLLSKGDLQKVVARFYEKRCADFVKLIFAEADQEAYDVLPPLFKKQFAFEKIQAEFVKSRTICGKLKGIELEGFGVEGPEADKFDRMYLIFALDTEKGAATGKITLQFAGMQSIITGFNINRKLPAPPKAVTPPPKS